MSALINNGDIITEVLVRNNRTTTDAFITDSMLQGWLGKAHIWATAQHKWPCTEGRVSTTWSGAEELTFEGYKMDSFKFIQIGGKVFQKMNFRNYQQMRNEQPGNTMRVFSDYGRTMFVNPIADASGTLVAYGQYQPVLDTTDLTAETVFSSWDAEANEALVEKISSFLKRREHKPDEADTHDKRAYDKLTEVAGRISEEQYEYQLKHGDGIFKRIDVVRGGFRDDITSRDQFTI
jgi:hypothetical protein